MHDWRIRWWFQVKTCFIISNLETRCPLWTNEKSPLWKSSYFLLRQRWGEAGTRSTASETTTGLWKTDCFTYLFCLLTWGRGRTSPHLSPSLAGRGPSLPWSFPQCLKEQDSSDVWHWTSAGSQFVFLSPAPPPSLSNTGDSSCAPTKSNVSNYDYVFFYLASGRGTDCFFPLTT